MDTDLIVNIVLIHNTCWLPNQPSGCQRFHTGPQHMVPAGWKSYQGSHFAAHSSAQQKSGLQFSILYFMTCNFPPHFLLLWVKCSSHVAHSKTRSVSSLALTHDSSAKPRRLPVNKWSIWKSYTRCKLSSEIINSSSSQQTFCQHLQSSTFIKNVTKSFLLL